MVEKKSKFEKMAPYLKKVKFYQNFGCFIYVLFLASGA